MNNKSDSKNKTVLKAAKVLSSDVDFELEDAVIKPAERLSDSDNFAVIEQEEQIELLVEKSNDSLNYSSKGRTTKRFAALSLLVLFASVAELVSFVITMTEKRDWLAAVWLAIFVGLLFFVIQLIWREWRGLKSVKRQQQSRIVTEQLFHTPAIGLAEAQCEKIAETLPIIHQDSINAWRDNLDDHLTDNEVLSLFEQQVLAPIDNLAIKTLTKNASAAGVMIAVSPFALLDMLIVLWRNVQMINQLSEIYGVKVGYWGRVKLIKNIFHSMVYAGAAEILSDAGNYALGAGITGKLSTRIAQGLGASVLTARIGLKALNECRPMPSLSVTKPNLTMITKQLLAELTNKIR
ncbi:YcjF family protein [Paraglaciecola sp. L3A3]|uniref:YcjF family protein n=1 Tax=Paraglaciecola sp. L3A3 TaxID=2686358 RepID=UPI00131CDACF|nr:TIGR01620 family protein [Paraglaciecola sp. L3A3]